MPLLKLFHNVKSQILASSLWIRERCGSKIGRQDLKFYYSTINKITRLWLDESSTHIFLRRQWWPKMTEDFRSQSLDFRRLLKSTCWPEGFQRLRGTGWVGVIRKFSKSTRRLLKISEVDGTTRTGMLMTTTVRFTSSVLQSCNAI